MSFEQGGESELFFAEEILIEHAYKKTVKATDRATMMNLMAGLNGYTLCSSIYSEKLNKKDFSDRDTVVYGHHMKNGTMFGSIEEYQEQEFYDAAPTMMLYTPEGDYLVELISGTVENGNQQFVEFEFEDEDAFMEYVNSFIERSTFKSKFQVHPGDRLISLCTCAYVFNNARYMLIGRLVPLYDAK